MTLAEFLAWEELQEGRHEFVNGEVFAMAGGTLVHAKIAMNLAVALDRQLAGRGCEVLASDAQVLAGEDTFYPDISVSCGPDALEGGQIKRPVLLAEVLSSSTESYDRGLKWKYYQDGLPSLRTFLLVAQDRVSVEVFRRGVGVWTYSSHTRLDEVLELSDPPCRLTIAEIYRGVLDRLGSGGV